MHPWGSLVSRPNLLGDFQGNEILCLEKKKKKPRSMALGKHQAHAHTHKAHERNTQNERRDSHKPKPVRLLEFCGMKQCPAHK